MEKISILTNRNYKNWYPLCSLWATDKSERSSPNLLLWRLGDAAGAAVGRRRLVGSDPMWASFRPITTGSFLLVAGPPAKPTCKKQPWWPDLNPFFYLI
jgi:hypothetical protein